MTEPRLEQQKQDALCEPSGHVETIGPISLSEMCGSRDPAEAVWQERERDRA